MWCLVSRVSGLGFECPSFGFKIHGLQFQTKLLVAGVGSKWFRLYTLFRVWGFTVMELPKSWFASELSFATRDCIPG